MYQYFHLKTFWESIFLESRELVLLKVIISYKYEEAMSSKYKGMTV